MIESINAPRMVSPNDMMDAAKQHMLNGAEPTTREDWLRIVNFLAANLDGNIALSAIKLMRMLYHMPITLDDIAQIVDFQLAARLKTS